MVISEDQNGWNANGFYTMNGIPTLLGTHKTDTYEYLPSKAHANGTNGC